MIMAVTVLLVFTTTVHGHILTYRSQDPISLPEHIQVDGTWQCPVAMANRYECICCSRQVLQQIQLTPISFGDML